MENIQRLNQALFPPSTSSMQSLCEEGFDDAVRFLKRDAWMSWWSDPVMERTDFKNKHEAKNHLKKRDN